MIIEHRVLLPSCFDFKPDFEFDPPVTRLDPKTNRMLVGRPTKGFGDSDFAYAGKVLKCAPWSTSSAVSKLKEVVEHKFNVHVEYVLIGYYEDGSTGIPFHFDEMKSDQDLIINLSFGDPRLFRVKWEESQEIDNYIVKNGEVLVFDGEANKLMQHDVPSLKGISGKRYSLTFRTVNRNDK